MSVSVLIIILVVHFILSFGLLLNPKSKLRRRKEYILPILFVPLFGPLMAITIDLLYVIDSPGMKPVELEPLKLEPDIFWTSFAQLPEEKDIIPLEEAILLNNSKTRRKAVLNTFREDSSNFLDVLMVARNNDDIDTTHYATIQISKIQRQFQLKLQKFATDLEKDPKNLALLDAYIDMLGGYIQSPLPEKSILRHQRGVYARLLDQKLALTPADRETYIKKLRNCTELGEDYPSALNVIAVLKKNWPEDERTWIEVLRACVEWKDPDRVRATIREMRALRIRWTKYGRELVQPWVQAS